MQKWFPRFLRLFFAIILAYPFSGVVMGIVAAIKNPSFLIHSPLALIAGSAWFIVLTPIYAGFPPADEGLINHKNMYPWIIPTAFGLFFLFSKGWRWFKHRPKP